jgi:hypothetical protein
MIGLFYVRRIHTVSGTDSACCLPLTAYCFGGTGAASFFVLPWPIIRVM